MGAGRGKCPPPKFGKNIFSGNYHVQFGHFINFSYIYFRAKCLAPKDD